MQHSTGEGLLAGCRVLDLADEKGILCGKILGDLGADVIKLEPPGGDPARHNGPFYKDIPHPEKSLFWWYTNLNKRGITLNLETEDGRDLFRRLVRTADFVIESFEPDYMASLGLSYAELEKINRRVIMTSITPFGQSGPYAHYKATDLVGVAIGGMVRMYGDPGRPPVRISAPQFYSLGGIHGAVGSTMAHYYRELTGEGQHVDVSCQQAVVLSLMMTIEYWDLNRLTVKGAGPFMQWARPAPLGSLMTRQVFPCKDGYVVIQLSGGVSAGAVKSSSALYQMAAKEGYALEFKDYDWRTYNRATIPQENMARMEDALALFLKTKTKAELFKEAIDKEILLIPVNDVKDVAESPQLATRGFFKQVEHPELGDSITYPGSPVQISESPYRIRRRAPRIGEHNEEIYGGELGLSKEEMVLLKTRGVI